MDKIYSRKRIKLPRIKRKKLNKVHSFMIIILLIVVTSVGGFIYASYPIFVASCNTAASSKATHIVSDEVRNVMGNYTYNDLVDVEKDANGDVVLMKYNTVLINEITSTIASNIQKSIDDTPRIMVYINYGSVSRNQYLKKFRA